MSKTSTQESTRVEALSPKEILDGLNDIIPGFIIEAVNNLLKKEFRGGYATILQKDISAEAIRIAATQGKTVTAQQIYDENWMDWEPIFRKAGWKVTYDKPGYNESYDASFEFKPKK